MIHRAAHATEWVRLDDDGVHLEKHMTRRAATHATPKNKRPPHRATAATEPVLSFDLFKPGDRITDKRLLEIASRLAGDITSRYTISTWCRWTHHQNHGWWSHVVSANFAQSRIRFLRRDYDDLVSCWQRCQDEEHVRAVILEKCDAVTERAAALEDAARDLRDTILTIERANAAEQSKPKRRK